MTAAIHWVDVPGMTRYSMEFMMMSADGRAVLTFPSPYLRNAAAELIIEGSAGGGVRSFKREEVTSYESGFKAELAQFHAAVTAVSHHRPTGPMERATSPSARRSCKARQSVVPSNSRRSTSRQGHRQPRLPNQTAGEA